MMATSQSPVYQASPRLIRGLGWIAAAGGGVFLAGTMISPERAWGGYLMGFTFFVGLALAGPLFLSVLYLSNARWGRPLRRIPEALTSALPVAFVLGLGLILGTHALYEWSHDEVVASDPLLAHKAPWLNLIGFSVRIVIYFAIWLWAGRRVAALSSAGGGEGGQRRSELTTSALFLAALAITFSLASVDWIQSLDAHWFSTMFALRTLSGAASSGLAVCILLLVALRRANLLRSVVTHDVMDDLGKILLALSFFWAYIWYCEYMIIWYSDIPEETIYYLVRRQGAWGTLVPVNLALNFAIPFLALFPRAWRRNGVILMRIAGLLLVGRVLDLYLMIVPPLGGGETGISAWEAGPLIGILALFGLIVARALSRPGLVPSEAGPAA